MQAKTEAIPTTARASALLTSLVAELVDHPQAVTVATVDGSSSTIFEVSVARDDVKRLVGRKGRTADAVRLLLGHLGTKAGRRYRLEILEPPLAATTPAVGSSSSFSVKHED